MAISSPILNILKKNLNNGTIIIGEVTSRQGRHLNDKFESHLHENETSIH